MVMNPVSEPPPAPMLVKSVNLIVRTLRSFFRLLMCGAPPTTRNL